MSNETKRDVFDGLLKEHCKTILDLNPASAETDVKQIVENVFRDRYAAAMPDDMPVIPKAVGEILQSAQGQTNLLGMFDTARNGHKVSEPLAWIIANQNTFATSWLLGVWRIEGTGEIVKLEEE